MNTTPMNRRRGVTSLLAMLYLMLFSTLAIGFFAATTTQSQISSNDENAVHAALAAETGMDFVRRHLALVQIPPLTAEANLLEEVRKDLSAMMDTTDNLQGHTVQFDASGTVIEVPGGVGNYIQLVQNGPRFRATITKNGTDLIVKAVGISGSSSAGSSSSAAGVQLTFAAEQLKGKFFEYGMASKGSVLIDSARIVGGVPASLASVLSALDAPNPVTVGTGNLTSPGGIAGEITVVEGRNPVIRTGASVDGTTTLLNINNDGVHYIKPADVPEFPVVDTAVFKQYATNNYVAGLAVYDNVRIPPNTNPTFNGPTTVRGVVFIEQPNIVTFNGNVTMQAVVVTEDLNVGTLGSNIVRFNGNGGAKQTVADLPDEPQFAEVRKLTGSFVLAPGFQVQMSGNFGSINGHIVGDRVTVTGSADATVRGSVVALEPDQLQIGGSARITFSEQASFGHAGLRFKEHYKPVPTSYREVRP